MPGSGVAGCPPARRYQVAPDCTSGPAPRGRPARPEAGTSTGPAVGPAPELPSFPGPHGRSATRRSRRARRTEDRAHGWGTGPGPRSEVMPAAPHRMAGHPEQRQDGTSHDHDDADRPDDGNVRDEPDNKQDNAENNQGPAPGNTSETLLRRLCRHRALRLRDKRNSGPCRTTAISRGCSCRGPEQHHHDTRRAAINIGRHMSRTASGICEPPGDHGNGPPGPARCGRYRSPLPAPDRPASVATGQYLPASPGQTIRGPWHAGASRRMWPPAPRPASSGTCRSMVPHAGTVQPGALAAAACEPVLDMLHTGRSRRDRPAEVWLRCARAQAESGRAAASSREVAHSERSADWISDKHDGDERPHGLLPGRGWIARLLPPGA
jgi:hypothetical protein